MNTFRLPLKLSCLMLILLLSLLNTYADSVYAKPQQDSDALRQQDMLMLMLSPAIQNAVNQCYSFKLKELPLVYPYQNKILDVERTNGFRGFQFQMTVEVMPVVGPHIPVGIDRITLQISPGPDVQVIEYTHIQDMKLPKNWEAIERSTRGRSE